MRILIIANTGWYLYKFRYNLIQALISRGHSVCISSPDDEYAHRLVSELGVQWSSIPGNPRYIVAHKEAHFVYRLFVACRRFRPDICLTYTPRVNCFITLLPLRLMGIKLVRNISGVGDSLLSGRKMQSLISTWLYKRGRNAYWTFYQNQEDLNLGINEGFSRPENASLLPGSGVDLEQFPHCQRHHTPPHRVLMVARLIPAKGYLDYIELAKEYRANSAIEFHLAGGFSEESGITRQNFDDLVSESGVIYHGYIEHPIALYAQSELFILPSTYGEGLPRVLLEAAACGCILLAYHNAGSNRAIRHKVNGWTTTEASVGALQPCLQAFLSLTDEERQAMSKASRQHVEDGFSETVVINAYLDLLTA